jgi:hypothetical protein
MFSRDPAALAEQCGENARDTNEALDRKVTGYLKTVARYSATGDTETRLAIAVGSRPPFAIILARANETLNPSAPVACTPTLNFYFVRGEYGVFEPDGLTADTLYDLTFLVLE